tara:strand:+ start:189 stop:446 length:258 start_codon:yes stop_codon:yes gene_type:complete
MQHLNWKLFLAEHGTESEGFLGFNKKLRYNEGILEEGEVVAVLGKGTWKSGKDLNINGSLIQMLEIKVDKDLPVYLSDNDSTTNR